MRIKLKTDRYGLPMWLSWSRRVTAFKLYFCSQEHVLEWFSLFVKEDERFCKICIQQRLIMYQTHCSNNICFTFLTAGWFVVTKGNKRSWPFGYSNRDPSMMFSEYPLALRRCLNFKRPSSNAFLFGRVSFKQSYCLPLMKPYFTPGGWHHRRPKLTSREKANN